MATATHVLRFIAQIIRIHLGAVVKSRLRSPTPRARRGFQAAAHLVFAVALGVGERLSVDSMGLICVAKAHAVPSQSTSSRPVQSSGCPLAAASAKPGFQQGRIELPRNGSQDRHFSLSRPCLGIPTHPRKSECPQSGVIRGDRVNRH